MTLSLLEKFKSKLSSVKNMVEDKEELTKKEGGDDDLNDETW